MCDKSPTSVEDAASLLLLLTRRGAGGSGGGGTGVRVVKQHLQAQAQSPPQKKHQRKPVVPHQATSTTSHVPTGIRSTTGHSRGATTAATPLKQTPLPLLPTAPQQPSTKLVPTYHVINLQRFSTAFPWGISLTLFQGPVLVVGTVAHRIDDRGGAGGLLLTHHHHPPLWVRSTSKAVSSLPPHVDPIHFWSDPPRMDIATLTSYLLHHDCGAASTTTSSITPFHFLNGALQAGDCILGLNGRSVRDFEALSHITQYMRHCLLVQLVVLRMPPTPPPQPVHASTQLPPTSASNGNVNHNMNPSYRVAQQAYDTLHQYLCHQVQTLLQQSPHHRHRSILQLSLPSTPRVPPTGGGSKIKPVPVTPPAPAASTSFRTTSATAKRRTLFPTKRPTRPNTIYTNPLFRDADGKALPFDDNDDSAEQCRIDDEYDSSIDRGRRNLATSLFLPAADPDNGHRSALFVREVTDFHSWLYERKHAWSRRLGRRRLAGLQRQPTEVVPRRPLEWPNGAPGEKLMDSWWATSLPVPYRNPLFDTENGRSGVAQSIPFADNWEFDPDDGHRAELFVKPLLDFPAWLRERKAQWRERYHARPVSQYYIEDCGDGEEYRSVGNCCSSLERLESNVPVDFWTHQHFASFDHWLRASTGKWSKNYSWNRAKRKRLELDCEEIVHVQENFQEWLRVRKHHWLVLRRKRQRLLQQQPPYHHDPLRIVSAAVPKEVAGANAPPLSHVSSATCTEHQSNLHVTSLSHNPEFLLIDELLEEQEAHRKAREKRPPVDISFLFEGGLGCPDDTVVHILGYLEPKEYSKLLRISRRWRQSLSQREAVWRQLCPLHWKLPRRPRKSWHELFFKNLRLEFDSSHKRWDDLLSTIAPILEKGDHLLQVQRLVKEAERVCGFDVNYSSGVVCERNALLNLAVMHHRHKIVRWLVEKKKADIETCDRGHFTPLLNAAWAGDKYLVRFLLQRGADRSKLGRCHYTKPLAAPDFEGLTAADWADKKGYADVATLIRMGL